MFFLYSTFNPGHKDGGSGKRRMGGGGGGGVGLGGEICKVAFQRLLL